MYNDSMRQHPAKARASKRDLGWLAGIIDGEGYIGLAARKKSGIIMTMLEVGNTNEAIARKATRIMKTLTKKSIACYPKNQQNGYRPCWKVQATSQAAIEAILRATLPDLEGKRAQAELMLKYLSLAPGSNRNGGKRSSHSYATKHYDMVSEMKHLNRRYAKGEWTAQQTTERQAPEWVKRRSELIEKS